MWHVPHSAPLSRPDALLFTRSRICGPVTRIGRNRPGTARTTARTPARATAIMALITTARSGICSASPIRDSSCQSHVIAGSDEHTRRTDVQDPGPALVEQGAQAPWLGGDPVRSRDAPGGCADRQTWAVARPQRRRHADLPDDEGPVRHGAPADRATGMPLVRVTLARRVRRKPPAPDRP
jgi:hypothetical protein